MTRSYFLHDGIRFEYAESGSGPAFVFQHGLGAGLDQTFDLLGGLPDVRLIAMDARAHGGSDVGPEESIGFNTFGNDLRALFDHLGIKQAVTGGLSMGAGIALNFALKNPQMVRALVLLRPAWVDQPMEAREYYFAVAEAIREHGPAEGGRRFRDSKLFQDLQKRYPDMAKSVVGQFDSPRAQDGVARLERMPAGFPNGDRSSWKRIQCPTLVLAHVDDPVHPLECGEAIAAAIPQAQFVEIVPKSQNLALHEEQIRRHVGEFLRRIL